MTASSINSYKLASLLEAKSEITPATLAMYHGPVDGFSIFLKQLASSTGKLAMKDRVSIAINRTNNWRFTTPDVFLTTLGYTLDPDPAIIDNAGVEIGETLLHVAAENIGFSCLFGRSSHLSKNFGPEARTRWQGITGALLKGGANLHASYMWSFDESRRVLHQDIHHEITPLKSLFKCVFFYYPSNLDPMHPLSLALSKWISALYSCGVDLEEYGRREHLAWDDPDQKPTNPETEDTGFDSEGRFFKTRYQRLVGVDDCLDFSYGRTPQDWKVWKHNFSADYVRMFWEMVERREEVMPGTWVD